MGLLCKKSTVHALLSATDDRLKSLETGADIGAVFFNLTKAFDAVPHRAQLEKLTSIGHNKYLIKWVASYLTGQKQQAVVNGSCSNFLPIISGMPQGSHLYL